MTKVFIIEGTDLASRKTAAVMREHVEYALRDNAIATLDFASVLSVSESYADEIFGVLIDTHSLGWLFEHVKVLNARPEVTKSISLAIRRRLEVTGQVDASLLLAKEELRKKACNTSHL